MVRIESKWAEGDEPDGVFSFVYYYLPGKPFSFDSVYMRGIRAYIQVCQENPAFYNWRVVIYTNQETYDKIQEEDTDGIFTDVYFQVVQGEEDKLILRLYRFHAFFQWRDIPVFVRDADTLFPMIVDRDDFPRRIGDWESTFLEEFRNTGKTFCVAVQPGHYQELDHHHNIYYDAAAKLGAYAGCISSLSFTAPYSLWEDILLYVKFRCRLVSGENETGRKQSLRWGTDEQIILFVILPAMIKKTHFFYLEYVSSSKQYGLTRSFYKTVIEPREYGIYEEGYNFEIAKNLNVEPYFVDGIPLDDETIDKIWENFKDRAKDKEFIARALPNPFMLLDTDYVKKAFMTEMYDPEKDAWVAAPYASSAMEKLFREQVAEYEQVCALQKRAVRNNVVVQKRRNTRRRRSLGMAPMSPPKNTRTREEKNRAALQNIIKKLQGAVAMPNRSGAAAAAASNNSNSEYSNNSNRAPGRRWGGARSKTRRNRRS
jgi:hypothetical protein